MSRYVKCDKCGEIMPTNDGESVSRIYTRDEDGFMAEIMADLCDKCTRDLSKWLKNE